MHVAAPATKCVIDDTARLQPHRSLGERLIAGMTDLRTRVATPRGDLLKGMSRQTRWMFAAAMTWGSVLIATARLLP